MDAKDILKRNLARTLMVWSVASIIIGVILSFVPDLFIQGIGLQAILWGIIDSVIALVGFRRKQDQPIDKIAKVLLVNVILDIGYQLVGLLLFIFVWQDPYIVGNGVGVIIQGAFLFVLDFYYYLRFKRLGEAEGSIQTE